MSTGQMGYHADGMKPQLYQQQQQQQQYPGDKQRLRKNVVVVALDRAAALVKSALTAFSSNGRRNRSDPIFS